MWCGYDVVPNFFGSGGRNVTISLVSRNGHANMPAIVGTAVFTQFWYWYPFTHMLSLAFTPTAVIGLNKNLEVRTLHMYVAREYVLTWSFQTPKFEFVSNARPSLFAYPPQIKPPSATVVEKVATAVLSTTAKAKARAKKSEKEKGDMMDVDKEQPAAAASSSTAAAPTKEDAKEEKPKKKREENFEVLQNMARVVPAQFKYISFKEESRYTPLKKSNVGGIVMLLDKKPGEKEDLIQPSAPSGGNVSLSGISYNMLTCDV